MNVVKNAIAYTNAGGSIRIQSEIAEAHWVCQINDNGIGIPENMHESIFERFFRVDPSRQRESGGIGLGLAIAREIAHLHGGTLRLAWSESGKGSRFEIKLPLNSRIDAPRDE
jgi:two-component system phosphate regulon sensor histidine kinase PhoR